MILRDSLLSRETFDGNPDGDRILGPKKEVLPSSREGEAHIPQLVVFCPAVITGKGDSLWVGKFVPLQILGLAARGTQTFDVVRALEEALVSRGQ